MASIDILFVSLQDMLGNLVSEPNASDEGGSRARRSVAEVCRGRDGFGEEVNGLRLKMEVAGIQWWSGLLVSMSGLCEVGHGGLWWWRWWWAEMLAARCLGWAGLPTVGYGVRVLLVQLSTLRVRGKLMQRHWGARAGSTRGSKE
jgi:hypothetical protein